jgi:hypothetical protein
MKIFMKNENSLPYALHIAAGATQIDNIKVIPTNEYMPLRKSVFIWKSKDWEKKLIDACVKALNEDIKVSLIDKKSPSLYVYALGHLKHNNKLFAMMGMHYDIH